MCCVLPERDVSIDVALHSDSEPVFFLPQLQDHAIVSSAGASQAVRLPLETDPALARREGVETISGRMTLAFGAVSIPVSRERSDAVHFLQLILASGIAGTFGLLLTLVWTAGFVPTFLDPSAVSVLLAKPIPRWQFNGIAANPVDAFCRSESRICRGRAAPAEECRRSAPGRGKGTSLSSDSLAPKPVASSVYVRVHEARCPHKWSISVTSLFPSSVSRLRGPHLDSACSWHGAGTGPRGATDLIHTVPRMTSTNPM